MDLLRSPPRRARPASSAKKPRLYTPMSSNAPPPSSERNFRSPGAPPWATKPYWQLTRSTRPMGPPAPATPAACHTKAGTGSTGASIKKQPLCIRQGVQLPGLGPRVRVNGFSHSTCLPFSRQSRTFGVVQGCWGSPHRPPPPTGRRPAPHRSREPAGYRTCRQKPPRSRPAGNPPPPASAPPLPSAGWWRRTCPQCCPLPKCPISSKPDLLVSRFAPMVPENRPHGKARPQKNPAQPARADGRALWEHCAAAVRLCLLLTSSDQKAPPPICTRRQEGAYAIF